MRLNGKVALITGAARGQGRSHAVRLAEEGAAVIALDSCTDVASVPYPCASLSDLEETVRLIDEAGGQSLGRQVDVRSQQQLDDAVADGVAQFGGIDIVCANAGIISRGLTWELTDDEWNDVIDVNLTGVWRTVKSVMPTMIKQGRGGSIVIISSSGGLKGISGHAHYTASKHGVLGIARTLAAEAATHFIRVNSIHPGAVATPMILNEHTYEVFRPDLPNACREDVASIFQSVSMLPIPWVEPIDISNAVLWLASDESRYVTGLALSVDAGTIQKYT